MNPIHTAWHDGPRCAPQCPGPFSSYHEGYADGLATLDDLRASMDTVLDAARPQHISTPEGTRRIPFHMVPDEALRNLRDAFHNEARRPSGELPVSRPAADTTRRDESGSTPAPDASAGRGPSDFGSQIIR